MNIFTGIFGIPKRLYWYASNVSYRQFVHLKCFKRFGYSGEPLDRVVQVNAWKAFLESVDTSKLDVLEISPGNRSVWKSLTYRSYKSVDYPSFDICKMKLDERFDLIIADNVFEHLQRPATAACNVFAMLKERGHFLTSTPFLIRVHGSPYDFSRWTPDGLKALLVDCGWAEEEVKTTSWGNKAAARAYLDGWPLWGFGRYPENDPEYPVSVWAIARKTAKP
jgi:SAM-dependent methyltransferase